jgi:GNAT superfamily N-acetyltransferase
MSTGNSPIKVRRAVPQDLPWLVQFNANMARETEGKTLDPDRLKRGVAAVLEQEGLGFYLLAEIDGQIAGQLLVTTEWSDWRNAFFWWVQSVYVLPQFRRQGVYRELDQRVWAEARSQGNVCGVRLYVDRDNLVAQQTYRGLGMHPARYDMYELELETDT